MALEKKKAPEACKKSITRSPGYPAFDLEEAIKKVRTIYDADKTAGTPRLAAMKYMGFTTDSGPANMAISALKKFGLIEMAGGRVVPTQRAISILILPEQDMRRKSALREAALSPNIYQEYFTRFKDQGMPSAESFEHELLLGGKFNHNAVKSFVQDFRETLKFSGLADSNGVILPEAAGDNFGANLFGDFCQHKPKDDSSDVQRRDREMAANIKEDVFTLDEGSVVIQWPTSMSAESYQDFEGWIHLVLRKIKRSIGGTKAGAD